jgi:rare lipoprotein A
MREVEAASPTALARRQAMIRSAQAACVALALLATACDRASPPEQGKTLQTGKASFYGSEFAGEKTASGETCKTDAMTAASRTLPLGSHVEVTNRETGQTAKVRINDRGPYAKGRVIDLTPKAARHIGIDQKEGVAEVSIKTDPSHEPRSGAR